MGYAYLHDVDVSPSKAREVAVVDLEVVLPLLHLPAGVLDEEPLEVVHAPLHFEARQSPPLREGHHLHAGCMPGASALSGSQPDTVTAPR